MSNSILKYYYFDTSIFIRIHRFYPIQKLWDELELLVDSGSLLSHIFVYNELKPNTTNPDDLVKWAKRHKSIFKNITRRQTEIVEEIVKKFPSLIDYNKEIDDADPWIIAIAKEESEKPRLFSEQYIVVSTEKSAGTRIPNACNYLKVPHMDFFEFIDERGYELELKDI